MKIISLQVSDDILDRFETVRIKSGFSSKSEALRDAIIKFIENYENYDMIKGYRIMAINLVYPFKESIINEISEINHRFHAIIKAITDWRIAEKKIEIMLAVGEFSMINDLYLSIGRIKDVICSIHEIIID